ncbi:MAG: hypothetical protein FWC58_06865 [Desulfobulbus sp.]|nr:hypothetical protein [Desulfobulbus sp.]
MTERKPSSGIVWGLVASLTAAGVAFTLQHEGGPATGATEARAIIPVKGDPPTLDVGGLTYYPSTGERVQAGDRLPVEKAIHEFSLALAEDAACVRRSCPDCETDPALFDLAADFVHQFGCATWNRSSLLALARAGRWPEHCDFYERYRFVRGFDCATPGNKVCVGVWKRAWARAALCHEAINES